MTSTDTTLPHPGFPCAGYPDVAPFPLPGDAEELIPQILKRFSDRLTWLEYQACKKFNPEDPETFTADVRRICMEFGGRIP